MVIPEEKYESIPQKIKKRNPPNQVRYYSTEKGHSLLDREKSKSFSGGEQMNWMYECVEDPTDAEDEDEYMFDEYIDMLIDRARGQD